MECYSELTVAIFVDGELPAEEARRLRDHLATCPRCRQLLDALRAENRLLSESLQELPEEAPDFYRSRGSLEWGVLAVVAVVLALGSFVVPWIEKLSFPEALRWLNPFSVSGGTNLVFSFFSYVQRGGTGMLSDYVTVIGGFFLLLLLGVGALLLGRHWRPPQPGLRLLIGLLALSMPGFALEHRHSDFVTVPASETVDDTLVAAGNTIRVDGVINGDLVVVGQNVEVHGIVKGDLISFAKSTVVSGTVQGNIYSLTQELDLDGQLGHNIYGAGRSVRVGDQGHVGGGIVAAAADATLEGGVTRSVTIAVGDAAVSGSVGRELTMAGDTLTLTNTARVGGNLTARVHELKNVQIADGATIAGSRDIQVEVKKSRFARPSFYFHQAIWFAGAMLVGWLALVLFPGFFQGSTDAVGSPWRSLGLGVAILAGVPLVVVVIAVTLVGFPLSLMLLALYLAAIYLAKVWVGAFLGRMLLKPAVPTQADWLLELLLGLLIITIVTFIPYFGGLVHLVVICLGLGAFAWQLYRTSQPVRTA